MKFSIALLLGAVSAQQFSPDFEFNAMQDYSQFLADSDAAEDPNPPVMTEEQITAECSVGTQPDAQKHTCVPIPPMLPIPPTPPIILTDNKIINKSTLFCGEREYLQEDGNYLGRCVACPPYQRSQYYGEYCGPDQPCDLLTSIINLEGKCITCQPGTQPDAARDNCVPILQTTKTVDRTTLFCGEREYLQEEGNNLGRCVACPPYQRSQYYGEYCGPDPCDKMTSIITIEGKCTPCFAGSQPDFSQNYCVTINIQTETKFVDKTILFCSEREYMQEEGDYLGRCVPCPDYQRSQYYGEYCGPDPCDLLTSFINIEGKCITCNAGTQPDATRNYCAPILQPEVQINTSFGPQNPSFGPQNHSNGQYVICSQYEMRYGNQCFPCPPYQIAQGDGSSCGLPNCDFRSQVVTQQAQCQTCSVGTSPDSSQKICVPSDGNYRPSSGSQNTFNGPQTSSSSNGQFSRCSAQQMFYNNQCYDCPRFQRSQGDGSYCGPDQCRISNEILTIQGTCVACENGKQPDQINRSCVLIVQEQTSRPQPQPQVQCNDRQLILRNRDNTSSSCQNCPPYTRAQEGGKYCEANKCRSSSQQIITPSGTCESCPIGTQKHSKENRCVNRLCQGEREMISADGKQCLDCKPYSRAQKLNTVCEPDQCKMNETLTYLGTCAPCPKGSIQSIEPGSCVKQPLICDERQIYNKDQSECITCDDYTRADKDKKQCLPDKCWYENQIVLISGKCEKCPYGQVQDQTKRICIQKDTSGICQGDRQILSPDGQKCNDCWPYTRAQNNNSLCRADRCKNNQRITHLGLCEDCPPGKVVNDWGRNCISQTEFNSLQDQNDLEVAEKSDKSPATLIVILSISGIILLAIIIISVIVCKVINRKPQNQGEASVEYDMTNIEAAAREIRNSARSQTQAHNTSSNEVVLEEIKVNIEEQDVENFDRPSNNVYRSETQVQLETPNTLVKLTSQDEDIVSDQEEDAANKASGGKIYKKHPHGLPSGQPQDEKI